LNGEHRRGQGLKVIDEKGEAGREALLLFQGSNNIFGKYKLSPLLARRGGAKRRRETRGVSVTVSAGLALSNIKVPLIPAQK
jgi:hypothetical protein